MKTLPNTLAFVLAVGLAGCQSGDKKAAETEAPFTVPASSAPATHPAATTPTAAPAPAANSSTVSLPAALPLTALDVVPAVRQLLPAEGYVQTVSAKPLNIEPMAVALPPLWGSLKPGAARSMSGYRIGYEAVVKWVPKGYGPGQKVPATMPLYVPNGKDSLARFSLGGINPNLPGQEKYTVMEVAPNKPVTVRGVVYAFTGKDGQQKPALVVYPYRHRGGMPDASKMVFLPINQ
ncbi:hypothetical protein [Hymenobacter sp. BT559]|uniref:hypothetical protein n=1 Tax=Hymenobacter sp. BT559 TaxID=2795729 RepID=UPI0018EC12E1|nr:hypothetical protein [Hymenobacter sp. BT559]MBJ6146325.1 hypothetical protein [Hymenobacter sp. BT559]